MKIFHSFPCFQVVSCEDGSTKCEEYRIYCDKNSYVTKRCQKTCGKCCEDDFIKCGQFRKYCDKNSYVTKRCPKTCGKCKKSPY